MCATRGYEVTADCAASNGLRAARPPTLVPLLGVEKAKGTKPKTVAEAKASRDKKTNS